MSRSKFEVNRPNLSPRALTGVGGIVVVLILGVVLVPRLFETVEPGYVKVATLFGKAQEKTFEPGLHFPVNPLYRFHAYDTRNDTHMETAAVPSQDQLSTEIDVSVQYRVDGSKAHQLLEETGTAERAKEVHLIPKLRSLLREQGKSIRRAEDFFMEETQTQLQVTLKRDLVSFLEPKGLIVDDVLIRDITLPARLVAQIEQKKEAEQQAERQKAELLRFTTEQEQLVVEAEARRKAAEQEAEQRKVLADAQAYEIERINEAIAANPAYIQLQVLDALKAISKDPAAKLYFMDGTSTAPLPFLNLGEPLMNEGVRN